MVLRRRSRRQQDRLQFTPVYYSVEHEDNDWESHLMDEELGKHVSIVKVNGQSFTFSTLTTAITFSSLIDQTRQG